MNCCGRACRGRTTERSRKNPRRSEKTLMTGDRALCGLRDLISNMEPWVPWEAKCTGTIGQNLRDGTC